jgi:CBS domain-containing protein
MKRRKPYSQEIRQEAVKLVTEQGLAATQVARDRDISTVLASHAAARSAVFDYIERFSNRQRLIAIALGSFGLASGNLVLVLVAIFIFFGANQENVESQAQRVLVTLKVGDAYNKHALTLEIGDRVSKVVGYILTSYQPDFAVMQGSKLLGIVTRDDVLRALADSTQDVYVSGIMKRDVVRVHANTTLDQVRQMMAEQNARVVAVYAGETYLGLVNRVDIAEAFAVIASLQRQQEARKAEEAGTRS